MPLPLDFAWLIPLLPFIGACLIGVLLVSFSRTVSRLSKPAAIISIGCLGISAVLSYILLSQDRSGGLTDEVSIKWQGMVGEISLSAGILVDNIGSLLLSITGTLLFVLMVSSHYYMSQKRDYVRFFVLLGFFSSLILAIVISSDLLEVYLFWLGIGAFSHLLRGVWFSNSEVVNIVTRTLVIDRLGDIFLLIGIVGLFFSTGSFEIVENRTLFDQAIIDGSISSWESGLICISLTLGPLLKASELLFQPLGLGDIDFSIPFSSRIHSITIAFAGIALVTRLQPVIEAGAIALSGFG